ncbi:MAG: aromatic ring-hydroxylating dioxygenase subunit alpha [Acidimicrobiia bacterium]
MNAVEPHNTAEPRNTAIAERATFLLPKDAYFDPAWYEREQRDLFGRVWNLVAAECDLPEPGDVLPVRVGADPVLLVRGTDGIVRGYLNMCRHRGMAIACEPGRAGAHVRCPYHGWEFSADDDTLVRIPQRRGQFADVDTAAWSLLPVSVQSWAGLVFCHPDPHAEPLERFLGHYPVSIGPFDTSALTQVARLRVPLRCNWKLYIENHIDVLHLWYLHDQSLGMYDHAHFHHGWVGPHWVSDEQLRPGAERPRGGAMLPIAHLPDAERDVLRANLIFPNVPTSSSETMWITYQVVPTGPETSELDVRVFGEPGSQLDASSEAILLSVLRDEDGFAVEQIQRVLRSPRFEVGPLAAAHELPITRFHELLLERLR